MEEKTGLSISQMIDLAKQGIKATDVLALNKAGYTPEIMKELSENGVQTDNVKQQVEEKQAEEQHQQQALNEYKESAETLANDLAEANKQIEELKKQVESIQAQNRGSDMSGEIEPDKDNLKDITEYVSSLM